MVATLVRLRFLLLVNGLRKSPFQIVAVVLGGLYGLFLLVTAVAGLVLLRTADIEFARVIVVLAGGVTVLGWTFLPVLTAGIDQTVDTARLAPFPVPINTLVLALAVSGVLGVPGIVTLVASLGTVVTWSRDPLSAVTALVCAVLAVVTAVVGSRMLAALASRVGAGRRAREARTLLVFVPLMLLGPIIFLVSGALRNVSDLLPVVAEVVGWTPFGAAWAVPADVASGDFGKAGLEFVIALATLVLFVALWRWGLSRALERPARTAAASVSKRGAGLFGMFPGTPTGAVAARALTYWIRDPRYAQSLVTIPIVPALLFFWGGFGENLAILVWVGPVVAVLLSMSIYTDISYDNTAFALHLQTGVSGLADRVGRVLALATFAVPVSLLLVLGSVAISNSWPLLIGLLGITIGVLLTGFGVSSIVSGRFTFAVPAPGDSPFKARPGGGFSLMLSTFATWAILGVLTLPEVVLALVGFATENLALSVASLGVGLVLGGVLLSFGVRWGGRILDARGPELLAQLQNQK